jgi:hypothetical protein
MLRARDAASWQLVGYTLPDVSGGHWPLAEYPGQRLGGME